MKKQIKTGIYKVIKIGTSFFPVFEFNDLEIIFLGNSYRTEKGAEKKLLNHLQSADIN